MRFCGRRLPIPPEGRKKHKLEELVAKLRELDAILNAGMDLHHLGYAVEKTAVTSDRKST